MILDVIYVVLALLPLFAGAEVWREAAHLWLCAWG